MTERPGFENAELIAFATSQPDLVSNPVQWSPPPMRWSELAVYFDHQPAQPGRHWIAVARGLSTHPGETTRETVNRVGTLERALKLFDEGSQLGRSVRLEAENWLEENIDRIRSTMPRAVADVPAAEGGPRPGFPNQEAALRWLYGEELDQAKPATLVSRDFGVGESTARMQMKSGRDIMVPLRIAARFFDHSAFQAAKEAARG